MEDKNDSQADGDPGEGQGQGQETPSELLAKMESEKEEMMQEIEMLRINNQLLQKEMNIIKDKKELKALAKRKKELEATFDAKRRKSSHSPARNHRRDHRQPSTSGYKVKKEDLDKCYDSENSSLSILTCKTPETPGHVDDDDMSPVDASVRGSQENIESTEKTSDDSSGQCSRHREETVHPLDGVSGESRDTGKESLDTAPELAQGVVIQKEETNVTREVDANEELRQNVTVDPEETPHQDQNMEDAEGGNGDDIKDDSESGAGEDSAEKAETGVEAEIEAEEKGEDEDENEKEGEEEKDSEEKDEDEEKVEEKKWKVYVPPSSKRRKTFNSTQPCDKCNEAFPVFIAKNNRFKTFHTDYYQHRIKSCPQRPNKCEFTCASCHLLFVDATAQKNHIKTHRYSYKQVESNEETQKDKSEDEKDDSLDVVTEDEDKKEEEEVDEDIVSKALMGTISGEDKERLNSLGYMASSEDKESIYDSILNVMLEGETNARFCANVANTRKGIEDKVKLDFWIMMFEVRKLYGDEKSSEDLMSRIPDKVKRLLRDIIICPFCVLNEIRNDNDYFTMVCKVPHHIVWAKLKGYPYWPAKVTDYSPTKDAFVCKFFGETQDKAMAYIPVKCCFKITAEESFGGEKASFTPSDERKYKTRLRTAVKELRKYARHVKEFFGTPFVYSSGRIPMKRETISLFGPPEEDLLANNV